MTNIELPDHSIELDKAKDFLVRIENELKWYHDTKAEIPYTKLRNFVYIADTVLGVVGDLSQEVFNVHDTMEQQYKMKYLQSPKLGKSMFLKDYHELHTNYDNIKNKCFNLLGRLDPKATIVETL